MGGWFPAQNAPPEVTDAPGRSLIRARARDLERNGDVTEGVIDAMIRNIVGGGYGLEAQVESSRGRPLDDINDRIEAVWKEWSRAENCDITGENCFDELLEMILRRWEVDGEVFILKVIDPSGYLPLKLQVFEPDMLAEDIFQNGSNYVFGGVEVDAWMKPVAYHFRTDPLPYIRDQKVTRIGAENVIHIFSKKRPHQVRGVPDMAVSMERTRNIQEYIAAELQAARTAASVPGFVTRQAAGGPAAIGRIGKDPKTGQVTESIQPNTITYMSPGDDIKFPQPGRPNVAAPAFLSMILRLIGMSRGLSYETVTRDISKTNYSSHRGGQLEDRKTYKRKQRKLLTKFCDRIYVDWFLEAAVLSGKLSMPNFFADDRARERYAKHRWSTPGWQWVDPVKEIQAVERQLSLGVSTMAEICGEQGKDWYEVLRARKREIEACKEMDMELPWFAALSQAPAPIDAEDGEKEDEESEESETETQGKEGEA
jgi:lambda family phage portal protein